MININSKDGVGNFVNDSDTASKAPTADALKLPLIYLEWEDSRSSDGWHDAKETEEYFAKSNLIKQGGWVYSEDKQNLCLVCRIGEFMWNESDDRAYGHIQKIPKTWIRKRKALKV